MQKNKLAPLFRCFTALSCAGGVFLHGFQLLFLSDTSKTSVNSDFGNSSFYLYALIGASLLFAFLSCKIKGSLSEKELIKNNELKISGLLFAAGFFLSFVHKAVYCISEYENIMYFITPEFVLNGLIGLLSLISSIYFSLFFIYIENGEIDFKALGFIHIAPVLTSILKLLLILLGVINIKLNPQGFFEMLSAVFRLCFFTAFYRFIQKPSSFSSWGFFITKALIICSAVFSIPAIASYFKFASESPFVNSSNPVCDLIISIAALCFLLFFKKTSEIKESE